jgi:hypothetical protein
MNSINWKFKTGPLSHQWRQIMFDSPSLTLLDIKRTIVRQVGAMAPSDQFDYLITNATTGEDYKDENYSIHKNTSLLIKKIPAINKAKAELIRQPASDKSIQTAELNKPAAGKESAEDASIQAVMNASRANPTQNSARNVVLQSSVGSVGVNGQYIKSGGAAQFNDPSAKPPPAYVCRKCNIPGHFIKYCPGIEVAKADAQAAAEKAIQARSSAGGGGLAHFLAPVMDPKDFAHGMSSEYSAPATVQYSSHALQYQHNPAPTSNNNSGSGAEVNEKLKCPICNKYFTNATFVPCCFKTFCHDCITDWLKNNNNACKLCKQIIDPAQLNPNKALQHQVDQITGKILPPQPQMAPQNVPQPLRPAQTAPISIQQGRNSSPQAKLVTKRGREEAPSAADVARKAADRLNARNEQHPEKKQAVDGYSGGAQGYQQPSAQNYPPQQYQQPNYSNSSYPPAYPPAQNYPQQGQYSAQQGQYNAYYSAAPSQQHYYAPPSQNNPAPTNAAPAAAYPPQNYAAQSYSQQLQPQQQYYPAYPQQQQQQQQYYAAPNYPQQPQPQQGYYPAPHQ